VSEFARLRAFVLWFISEPKQELGAPAPWSVKLAGNVIDPPTWCGAATTSLCGGRGDPHPLWRSSLVEPGAKVTVIVFTEETWWPSSNTLSECYNNVDVGVPLWLTEPRDKHPRQEFAISYPAL
jgi:hypothetical protein